MYLRLYSRRYIHEYSLKISGLGKFQFKRYNAGASIAFLMSVLLIQKESGLNVEIKNISGSNLQNIYIILIKDIFSSLQSLVHIFLYSFFTIFIFLK